MKRSRVRASLTTGATCAAASHSILHFLVRKAAGLYRLHHQHSLQHPAIDQRDSQKRVIAFLPRLAEELETRMLPHLFHGHRAHLLGDHSRQAFVQRHAQRADGLPPQAERRGQHEIGAIRFQQVGGADIGLEAPGNQRDHIHQRFRGLAAFPGQRAEFVQREDVTVGG